jgi:hypothetical protein
LDVLTTAVVHVKSDGTIHAIANSETARLIELLGLDSPKSIEYRKLWIDIVASAQADLFVQIMGYPIDLPDLRWRKRKPPGGNSRPDGVEQSAYARRERGELPACY